MRADLHLHTTFSDGILDPNALLTLAHERGVGFLSVTDHDCLDAFPEASRLAKNLGIHFVTGVELNCEADEGEVHILGYAFDAGDSEFKEGLLAQRRDRKMRFEKMFDKLNALGFDLDKRRVDALAGEGAVGRPHLARALIEKKVVRTVDEAFRKYLGYGKPAWIPRNYWTPQFAIGAIRKAGGHAVLAHPERGGKAILPELVACGLSGIETYYPAHTPTVTQSLSELAKKYRLMTTVGSDYHGINPGERGPGCVEAPQEVIESLLRILVYGTGA